MYTPQWPLTGYEHTDYSPEDIAKVVVYLRENWKMGFADRMYLATMLEQLGQKLLTLQSEKSVLEETCRKLQNG